MEKSIIVLLILAIILPVGMFLISEKKVSNFKLSLFTNILSFFGILIASTVFIFYSAEASTATSVESIGTGDGLRFLGAALATGLATVGAGIATGHAASSALGAISENEGIMGKALIFVALSEGIAIYGLLVTFMILNA